MRVDGLAQRRDRHAFLRHSWAPIKPAVRAAKPPRRWRRHGLAACAATSGARRSGTVIIGMPADQQHAERAGALRLRHAVLVGRPRPSRPRVSSPVSVDAPAHGLQQLTRIPGNRRAKAAPCPRRPAARSSAWSGHRQAPLRFGGSDAGFRSATARFLASPFSTQCEFGWPKWSRCHASKPPVAFSATQVGIQRRQWQAFAQGEYPDMGIVGRQPGAAPVASCRAAHGWRWVVDGNRHVVEQAEKFGARASRISPLASARTITLPTSSGHSVGTSASPPSRSKRFKGCGRRRPDPGFCCRRRSASAWRPSCRSTKRISRPSSIRALMLTPATAGWSCMNLPHAAGCLRGLALVGGTGRHQVGDGFAALVMRKLSPSAPRRYSGSRVLAS